MSLKICSVNLFSGALSKLLFLLHKDAVFYWIPCLWLMRYCVILPNVIWSNIIWPKVNWSHPFTQLSLYPLKQGILKWEVSLYH